MSIFQKKDQKVQKNIRIIIVTICVLLLCILGFSMSTFFQLKDLQITGCDYYEEEQIADEFQKSVFDHNTVIFYVKYKFYKKVSIPFVDDFDMDFINRNKIHINIYEKRMVSCIKYMGEYLYLDKDGTIVEASSEKLENIPLVSGLRFEEMILHEKLKVKNDKVFEDMREVSQLIEKYQLDIDKIFFNYEYEITLWSGDVRILLGKQEYYDIQIADLTNILPLAHKKKLKGVLDMKEYTGDQSKIIFREE